jgi:hypothetical protein
MPRYRSWTTSVESGEIAPEYRLRTDAVARNKGLLKARNARLLSSGSWSRRWGTLRKVDHVADCRYETIGIGQSQAVLFAFSNGRLDIYNSAWSLIQTITGCPWTGAHIHKMQVAAEANRVSVTHQAFYPQELVKTGATWSRAAKTFTPGQGTTVRQPYYRFQSSGVTLTPSALTGSITLTSSADHFVAGHIGARIRYVTQEILITAVGGATTATGTVQGALFPTLNVPVVTSVGFSVGDIVEGADSKVQGLVTGIPSGTALTVLLINGYENFIGGTTNENLVGPNQRSLLTAACTAATPAAAVDWDEALISDARGYPGGVAYHRGRQLLFDFPAAQNLLAASIAGDPDDFDTGEAGPNDAVIETVGRDDSLRVLFVGSMEQLLVFTEAGAYYVPETTGAPFSPTNAEFLAIGPEVIGNTPPVRVSEGMLFCEARSGRMLVLVPTGNVRRSWDVADLSELSFHMMGTPKKISVLPATATSDREIVVLKEDGSIAWMRYRRSQESAGWCPWDTEGDWRSMSVLDGRLFMSSSRTLNGVLGYSGEELSEARVLDGCVTGTTGPTPSMPTIFDGTNVTITQSNQTIYQGLYDDFVPEDWTGSVDVGFASLVEVEYPPPVDGENGQWRPMQIVRAFLTVEDSGSFRMNNYEMGAFMPESDEGALPPLWSETREHWVPGVEWEQTLTISQEIPAPLIVRALTLEVKS